MIPVRAVLTRARSRLGRPRPADVGSGLVTGLFSIPEGMAYAAIAGFNPVAGLYAGVVPTIVGSLTARTVLMVTTLTSVIALTSQSVLKDAGLDQKDTGGIATLTLMAGVVMVALTFLATTQIPLQRAIVLGAVLSLLLYCVQAARRARLLALVRDPEGRWHLAPVPGRLTPGEVTVLYYDGVSLFAELPGSKRRCRMRTGRPAPCSSS